jgi:hypothetical protein
MRTEIDRMKTAEHINRCFARSAELGTLEADEPKSADYYYGRADAYAEAAAFLRPSYAPFVPSDPCTCVDPFACCPTHG